MYIYMLILRFNFPFKVGLVLINLVSSLSHLKQEGA